MQTNTVYGKMEKDNDPEFYQHNDLWQNTVNPERREKARKIRKLSIDRYNLIEENSVIEKNQRRHIKPGKCVHIHPDWRLFDCCITGDEEELLYLLHDGISVKLKGSRDITPLHVAARHDQVRIAIYLLRHGANKDAKDIDGWTALHMATYYDNYGIMAILLEAGADVFALDYDLNYPINHVIDNSPLAPTIAKKMKDHKKIDPERHRLEHNRHLNELTLSMLKRAESAKCFVSGLKDFRNPSTGVTLVHCLATYGLHLALQTVIDNDPYVVHLIENSGFTPLHCAAKFGQYECIKILIRSGANIKAIDQYQRMPMFYAIDKQSQLLLSGTGSLQDFDDIDGSDKNKKSKKPKKKDLKPKDSRRRFLKSITSRKRPERVKTLCTKVLIKDLKRFELEAFHAKRRLVLEHIVPVSHRSSNRLNLPPQLPPRMNENDNSTRSSSTSLASTIPNENPINITVTPPISPKSESHSSNIHNLPIAKRRGLDSSENPYEIIKESTTSIPMAVTDSLKPPELAPKKSKLGERQQQTYSTKRSSHNPSLDDPQVSLGESMESLNGLPPPPLPPKAQSIGDISTRSTHSKKEDSLSSAHSMQTEISVKQESTSGDLSDSSAGDYSIPDRSIDVGTRPPNIFLEEQGVNLKPKPMNVPVEPNLETEKIMNRYQYTELPRKSDSKFPLQKDEFIRPSPNASQKPNAHGGRNEQSTVRKVEGVADTSTEENVFATHNNLDARKNSFKMEQIPAAKTPEILEQPKFKFPRPPKINQPEKPILPPKPIVKPNLQAGPVTRIKNSHSETANSNRRSYVETLPTDDSTTHEENEFQKYSKANFKALLSKFDKGETPIINGSISKRNVQLRLLPGKVDYDICETYEPVSHPTLSSNASYSSSNSSSSRSSSLNQGLPSPVPVPPQHAPVLSVDNREQEVFDSPITIRNELHHSQRQIEENSPPVWTNIGLPELSPGGTVSLSSVSSSQPRHSSLDNSIDLNEFEEMAPIEEEDTIWENVEAQLSETVNLIKSFHF